MCDCKLVATPQYSTPPPMQYSPPAAWDPAFDPDNSSIGEPPLVLVPNGFKYRRNLLPPPDRVAPPDEFLLLFGYQANGRTQHCKDICEQNSTQQLSEFFIALIDSYGKPGTNLLLRNVENDMLRVVLFQKKLPNFNRVRPYQVYPSLEPPFTPGHASYPSGHATQSHAIAKVIEMILSPRTVQYAGLIASCYELGDEIARNRERAGVHYPSDSAAGKVLANLFVEQARSFKAFQDRLAEAQTEWTVPRETSRKESQEMNQN
jgi:hypothetical protein